MKQRHNGLSLVKLSKKKQKQQERQQQQRAARRKLTSIPESLTRTSIEDITDATSEDTKRSNLKVDRKVAAKQKRQQQQFEVLDDDDSNSSSYDDLLVSSATAVASPSFTHCTSRQQSMQLAKTQSQHDEQDKEGSSLTVYSNPVKSLSKSVGIWCHSMDSLVKCKEMEAFRSSSGHLIYSVGNVTFHVVCLPLAIPLHLSCETVSFIQTKCLQIQKRSSTLACKVITHLKQKKPKQDGGEGEEQGSMNTLACGRNCNSGSSTGESTSSDPPLYSPKGLIHFVCKTTDQVKNEIGASILTMFSPAVDAVGAGLGGSNESSHYSSAGQSSSEQENETDCRVSDEHFLDRLRLDYVPPSANSSRSASSDNHNNGSGHRLPQRREGINKNIASAADTSKFLLYVADLDVIVTPSLFERKEEESPVDDGNDDNRVDYAPEQLLYIDLGKEFSTHKITELALDHMYILGLSLFQNNSHVDLQMPPETSYLPQAPKVQWKPEGSTSKLLRRKLNGTNDEWIEVLRKETLIWSGKFVLNNKHHHPHQHRSLRDRQERGFFLARGIVKGSPKEFLHLLWDNTRTGEYNSFCLGRSNLLVLNDNNEYNDVENYDAVLKGSCRGTKVVKSETRVPFTGMSLMLTTMMHVRPLVNENAEGCGEESRLGEGPECRSDDNDEQNTISIGSCNENAHSSESKSGYIILSRSLHSGVAGYHTTSSGNTSQDAESTNDILWGINILRPVPNHPHLTDLTSLSQVSSSMVPKFLSHNIGIMGIENFFKNVREESAK